VLKSNYLTRVHPGCNSDSPNFVNFYQIVYDRFRFKAKSLDFNRRFNSDFDEIPVQ